MNPRSVLTFLKSKFGMFVVFLVVLFTGLWIYSRHVASEREAEKLASQGRKKVELGQMKVPLNQGLESGLPQQAKPAGEVVAEKTTPQGGIVPFTPPSTPKADPARPQANAKDTATAKPEPRPKKIRYASLLEGYSAGSVQSLRPEPTPPERFIPFGTLLKCKLVNTVDSANLETPVIALLLEDVWQNGKLVIPANTLVHGTAKSGRMRDRITASGTWRFVWQDGQELAFNGVALDREYDHEIDGYGITDGSGGIKGHMMASDDYQELKLMAAAALSGFARGTQDRSQTALGSTITGSVSNGVREGAGEVFDMYAKRTLKDIEQNGYFVRVPAGKEFYVYVLESVDPHKASIAGIKSRQAESQDQTQKPASIAN